MDCIVAEKTGTAIQKAIDETTAKGGGRVVLEAGTYLSGTIHLKSNIELHLSPGAVILGAPQWDAYEDFDDPGLNEVVPEKSRKCLIACQNSENVSITGSGEINGQGLEFFDKNVPDGIFVKPDFPRPRMVQFFNCRNVTVDGCSFVDSPNWTFWFTACSEVRVSRIRVETDPRILNSDGIDIDGCSRVTVSDSFFNTGDDCLILRAIRRKQDIPAICEQVAVTNCVLNSHCQGIRLGCPSDDTIRNCSFSNIIFKGGGNGIHGIQSFRYLRKNCNGYLRMSDIAFRNFDITTGQHPIRVGCEDGLRLRGMERLTFEDFRIQGEKPIIFFGNAETVLKNISLCDFTGTINGNVPIELKYVNGLNLRNVTLDAAKGEPVPFVRQPGESWETKF